MVVAGRRWVPVAEVALAPAVIVGRGGLEVELTAGRWVDPEAVLVLDPADADADADAENREDRPSDARPLAVVARREGRVVGVLTGWTWGPTTEITRAWLDPAVARQGVDDHLRSAFEWAATQRWAGPAAWSRRPIQARYCTAAPLGHDGPHLLGDDLTVNRVVRVGLPVLDVVEVGHHHRLPVALHQALVGADPVVARSSGITAGSPRNASSMASCWSGVDSAVKRNIATWRNTVSS